MTNEDKWKSGKPDGIGTYKVKDASGIVGFAHWSGLCWGNITRLRDNAWHCRFGVCFDIAAHTGQPIEGGIS